MDNLLESHPKDFTKSLDFILMPLQVGIALTDSKSGLLFSNSYMHQWLDTFTAEALNLKLGEMLEKHTQDDQPLVLKYGSQQEVIVKFHALNDSHVLCLAYPPTTAEQTVHSHLRLASRMKTLENLYRSMAHDLKSPLHASILNLARLQDQVRQYELPDEEVEALEAELRIIRTELSRLGESIQFFLSQASPEKHANRNFDLRRVQRECTWLVKSLAKKQRIRIKSKQLKTSVVVFGNRDRLKQAILNLLFNAIEAIQEDGEIILQLQISEGCAVLTIQDSGHGVPESQLEAIFEANVSTKPDGNGIGLSVTRSIVQDMGGTITLRNLPKQGVQVTIKLPLVKDS